MNNLIENKIIEILWEKSGGCKAAELVAALISWNCNREPEIQINFEDILDEISACKIFNVFLLEYDWEMNKETIRSKQFIYTKY